MTELEKIEEFERRISDPNDTDCISLVHQLLNKCSPEGLDNIRQIFESLLQKLPFCVRIWKWYVEVESAINDHHKVSALFARCLRSVQSFDLFSIYLKFIRRTYKDTQDSHSREIMGQAFKFVLVGIENDKNAGQIWLEYISFLRQSQVNSSFEEQKKHEEIRTAYQRAVSSPISNIKQLWKDWETFEHGVDRSKAKGILAERQSTFNAASNYLKTMKPHYDVLGTQVNLCYPPNFSSGELSQWSIWKAIIKTEKTNPLKLKDSSSLYARVSYVFWQALHFFPRFPELWFEFAMYTIRVHEKIGEGISILKNGIQMCPGSFILTFALADLLEAVKEVDQGLLVFDELIKYWEHGLEIQTKRIYESDKNQNLKECLSLSWIAKMRFAARACGINELRAQFKKARSKKYATWYISAASALLEFHRTKNENIAKNIFKYAIDTFPQEIEPVNVFSDWLMGIKDDVNFTCVLVKACQSTSFSSLDILNLFQKLSSFHSTSGSLQTLLDHEKDLFNRFPDLSESEYARSKFKFFNLDLISSIDLAACAEENILKRRILDEWTAPPHLPAPDVKAWVPFKPSKIPIEETRSIGNKSRILYDFPMSLIKTPKKTNPLENVRNLLSRLPTPESYDGNKFNLTIGPRYDAGRFINLLEKSQIPLSQDSKRRKRPEKNYPGTKRHRQ